jgi:hypothetical protein
MLAFVVHHLGDLLEVEFAKPPSFVNSFLPHVFGVPKWFLQITAPPKPATVHYSGDMKYHAPAGKQFRVVRETGSPLLLNKVLKELLVSEKEASDEQHRNSSGLTPENYDFQFVGSDMMSGRP